MTFFEFLKLLIRHKKLIFLFPLINVVLVFVITANQQKYYKSETTLYTGLVSGYTLESNKNERRDYFQINNAFDNLINIIKSKETIKAVSSNLILKHYLTYKNDSLSETLTEYWTENFTDEILALNALKNKREQLNYINTKLLDKITEKPEVIYHINKILKQLHIRRVDRSDLLLLSFKSIDPAFSQDILENLTIVLKKKYLNLTMDQTKSVIDYFERKMNEKSYELLKLENELKTFFVKNKIINYYEQTKQLAIEEKNVNNLYEDEKSNLISYKSALKQLEKKIDLNLKAIENNSRILTLKTEIISLKNKVSTLELTEELNSKAKIQTLNSKADKLEKEMLKTVNNVLKLNSSPEGVSKQEIVHKWLNYLIHIEESKARLKILRNRVYSIINNFKTFAPLGSELKRLERKIKITEKEYLDHLHSLSMSKLREQNIQLKAKIDLVDKPSFAKKAESSKRFIFLALSLIASLFLVIAYIIILDYLDKTIKSVKMAEELTGLSFVNAIPFFNDQTFSSTKRIMNQVISNIELIISENFHEKSSVRIAVLSKEKQEGKSFLIDKLSINSEQTGIKAKTIIAHHNPLSSTQTNHELSEAGEYVLNEEELIKSLDNNSNETARYTFIEIPALLDSQIPFRFLRKTDMIIWLINSGRSWSSIDKKLLLKLKSIAGTKILPVLNYHQVDRMEDLIGEINKKRNPIRVLIKRLSKLEFKNW